MLTTRHFRHLYEPFVRLKVWLIIILLTLTGTVADVSCTQKEKIRPLQPMMERIGQRGEILIGTTGDYRPLSFREPETGQYWGFRIELAEAFADSMGVCVKMKSDGSLRRLHEKYGLAGERMK